MIPIQCISCKHILIADVGLQCAAFPKQIPIEIWTGQHDHTKPYPGDNGIRFEPLDEEDTPANG